MRIGIIGAGLAGAACAYAFKKSGHDVVVFEAKKAPAQGASGNDLGLYNPRLSAFLDDKSLYYERAFLNAIYIFGKFNNIKWKRFGSLHFINDEKKNVKFDKAVSHWGWPDNKMRIVCPEEASEIAGVYLFRSALHLPDAGVVSPRLLCEALLEGVEVRYNHKIASLQIEDVDIVILSCAYGLSEFDEFSYIPLHTIRGQVTKVRATGGSAQLKANLCYGGYCSPMIDGDDGDGWHMVGATFQRWLDHDNILHEDDVRNLEQLAEVAPQIAEGLEVIGHRAALRVAAKDVFPVVGQVDEGLYVSAAHGSHGIISSLMAGKLLVEMVERDVRCLPVATVKALSPLRFS